MIYGGDGDDELFAGDWFGAVGYGYYRDTNILYGESGNDDFYGRSHAARVRHGRE